MDFVRAKFLPGEYHVIAVTETWLHSAFTDTMAQIPGYTLIRNDRQGRSSGGVALYIKNNIKYRILDRSIETGHEKLAEYLICEINLSSSFLVVAVVYRPPDSRFYQGIQFLGNLSNIIANYSNKLILGDFNADMHYFNQKSNIMYDFIFENRLYLVPHGATHKGPQHFSAIDLCIVDENDRVISFDKVPFINNHSLTDVTLDIFVPKTPFAQIKYRNIDGITQDEFTLRLLAYDWSFAFKSSDVDLIWDNTAKYITSVLDTLAPYKEFTLNNKSLPWLTPELKIELKHLNKLYRKYYRNRREESYNAYKIYKDLNEKIMDEKIKFYSEKLNTNCSSETLWKEINHLGLTKSSIKEKPIFTPDQLNNYFLTTQNATPSVSTTQSQNNSIRHNNFKFKRIKMEDLDWAFKQFSTKSVGPDGISLKVLKLCLPALSRVFLALFNKSIILNKFPKAWKHSNILPTAKVPNPSSLGDYRPVSLLCIISKIFEKILHKQISDYLNQQHLLDSFQSGFQKMHSTQTILTNLTDDICRGHHLDLITILVMIDLSKAFDRVSHEILLKKLSSFGFSENAIGWFSEYLSDRTQSVIYEDKASTTKKIISGVPQGSVLGPLLFLIYLNDLGTRIIYSKRLLYADDLQIYIQIPYKDFDLGISLLQNDIKEIEVWSSSNNFVINKDKTKIILFGKNVNDFYNSNNTFYFGGANIKLSKSVNNLGIFFDSDMKWNTHINHVVKSVNFSLYRLRYFKNLVTKNLRKQLVSALIFPLLDYCMFPIGNLPEYQYARLQKLQNAAVRYVCDIKYPLRTSPARITLGWLKVKYRAKYLCASYIYNILQNAKPDYLKTKINIYKPARELRPKNRPHLKVELTKNPFYSNSSLIYMISFCNSIPENIRFSSSISSFKTNLHKYLLEIDSRESGISSLTPHL